jgi:hypothetical protein
MRQGGIRKDYGSLGGIVGELLGRSILVLAMVFDDNFTY